MKSNRKLRLRFEAQLDIRSILRHTVRQWGESHKTVYRAELYRSMQLLVDQPERGRARGEYFPGCRSIRAESHVVFYYFTDNGVVISRILHVNQDANDRVKQ